MTIARRDLALACLMTAVGHGAIAWAVSRVDAPQVERTQEVPITIEVTWETPALGPQPLPAPPVLPSAETPEPNEPAAVSTNITKTKRRSPTRASKLPSENPPPQEKATEAPTPPATPSLPGGKVYRLDSLSPSATIPVATANATGGRGSGAGGPGTGSGQETSANSARDKGSPGPPVPVSIAMLKRRPVPIGNSDFFDARKNYPASAKQNGIEGKIRVKLVVNAKGRVIKRTLINRLGHGLDPLAMRLAKSLRFKPALDTQNNPVVATVVWTFTFTIPK